MKCSLPNQFPIVVLAGLMLFNINVLSQSLYLKAGLGYSLGTHKDYYMLESTFNQIFEDSTYSYSVSTLEKVNFGQGANFEVALGSFIGEYIAIELVGFYRKSNTQTIRIDEKNDYFDQYFINFYTESDIYGVMYGIKPCVLLWLGKENFKPYFKLGAVIGFGSITEETETRVFNTHPSYYPTENITSVFEYQRSTNLGYSAGAGFEIVLATGIRFYTEINYSGVNVVPGKGEYTEYKYRGNDIMNILTVSEIEYEYVDEYSSTENNSENTPTKLLKSSHSFSNVGIIAGLRFNIIQ